MNIRLMAIVVLSLRPCNAISGWFVSRNVRQEYIDGTNGKCGHMEKNDTLCERWGDPQVKSDPSLQTGVECSYIPKVRTTICYAGRNNLGNREEMCVRKQYFYQAKSNCLGQWLAWQNCSAECGGGLQRRYKLISISSDVDSFVSSNRSCNTQSCPMWSKWRPDSAGCRETCSQLYTRNCVQGNHIVISNRCLSNFASKIKNNTHKWISCNEGGCKTFPTTASSSPKRTSTLAFLPIGVTKTANTKENANFNKQISNIALGNNSFWIGYCLGFASMFFLIIIILLIVLKTRKGRAAIAVLQPSNAKTLDEKKIRHISTNNHSARSSHFNSSQTLVNRKLEGKMSGISMSSLCREENHINPHCASFSQPKYLESFGDKIEPIDYETFYTPVGESRLHNEKTLGTMSSFFANVQDSHRYSGSSESFMTDSGSETNSDQRCVSEIYDPNAVYQNSACYSTIGKGSQERKKQDEVEFDKVAYVKKQEALRAENRRQEKKYGVHKRDHGEKKARRQHRSIESQSTLEYSKPNEPHYATPMKNTAEAKNTASQRLDSFVDEKGNIKASSVKTSTENMKTKSKKINLEGTYQSFEFSSPPPFVVDEQLNREEKKSQENGVQK